MCTRPNILFILSDQHNAKYMGHTGLTGAITPNLDRLAAGGVRFDAAYCPVTICGPSRVAYHSGQYAHNSGRFGFSGPMPPMPTLYGHFRRAGYHTACIGKMHCPHYWLERDCDEFYETDRTSVGGSCKEFLDYQGARGINIYDEYDGGIAEWGPSPFAYEDSQEGWQARQAMQVMRTAQAAGKPFLVHLSQTKPHQPYKPARQFWDLYEGKVHLPPNADYDMHAAAKAPYLIHVSDSNRKNPNFDANRRGKLQGYLGNVTHCDFAIGQVLEFMAAQGLMENTIIVYSADHGEYAAEHGPGEKVPGIAADAVVRVPFIWHWAGNPAIKGGQVITDPVETIDVARTLCALAGVERLDTADGQDLAPVLAGQAVQPHRIAVTEYPLSKSVRMGKWRMVYYPPGFFRGYGPDDWGELYDLQADPWEMKNLYFGAQYAAVVRQMERELLDWLCMTGRPTTAYTPVTALGADGKITPEEIWGGTPCAPYL
ncbi:MAG: sulfatase-like hydrolase/transferase [Planctomycetaceae bacterium]|nr:sulfatase-like hydrolase/transferase [Planctomycetaceae bacterium]